MYLLKKNDLKQLLNNWTDEFEVYAPQVEDGQVMLLPFDEKEFTMDYINFAFPVKEFLFKQRDVVFKWEKKDGNIITETPEGMRLSKKVYFGIRACDAHGISYMDKFFLEGYNDRFYGKNKISTFIVAVNCTEAGEGCFCSSMGTGPFANKGYDVLFTPLEDVYLVEVGSEKGEELIAASKGLIVESNEELNIQKDLLECDVLNKFKIGITADNINKVLKENFNNPIWQEISKDCVACTGCTSVCPTCTCFNVVEESTGVNSGCRVKVWDSCQSDSFTRNAGEHNPRTKEARVKYRIYDKFKYIEDKFNYKGCSGCGRCINVCPASINVVKIINKLAENNLSAETKGDE